MRPRDGQRIAAIDIGTNSVRLLLAQVGRRGHLSTIIRRGVATRLGEGLAASGAIGPRAVERTVGAARDFVRAAVDGGASAIHVTGTSALRTAANGARVAEEIGAAIGRPVRILSGEEEARLVFRAVCGGAARAAAGASRARGPCAVIDIGGGSTEVIRSTGDGGVTAHSLPLGAVLLTERFLGGPGDTRSQPDARAGLAAYLDGEIPRLLGPAPLVRGTRLHGVGGTLTALAATDKGLARYDPRLIEGHRLARERVEALTDRLWATPLAARQAMPGVDAGRADIVLAGSLVLVALLRALDARSIAVSTRGLRYGILLDALDRASPGRSGSVPSDTGRPSA